MLIKKLQLIAFEKAGFRNADGAEMYRCYPCKSKGVLNKFPCPICNKCGVTVLEVQEAWRQSEIKIQEAKNLSKRRQIIVRIVNIARGTVFKSFSGESTAQLESIADKFAFEVANNRKHYISKKQDYVAVMHYANSNDLVEGLHG